MLNLLVPGQIRPTLAWPSQFSFPPWSDILERRRRATRRLSTGTCCDIGTNLPWQRGSSSGPRTTPGNWTWSEMKAVWFNFHSGVDFINAKSRCLIRECTTFNFIDHFWHFKCQKVAFILVKLAWKTPKLAFKMLNISRQKSLLLTTLI